MSFGFRRSPNEGEYKVNTYHFQDLQIGQQESLVYEITEEKLAAFLQLTGDDNPLHTDDAFAQEMGHPGKVSYGMLSASMISTLAGVYLPGKYCLLQQVTSKFTAPVYVGDRITLVGTVEELNESVGQTVVKVRGTNQDGKTVLRGSYSVGFTQ
jgi:3-hydroxybutyryl-CoA dehydratase